MNLDAGLSQFADGIGGVVIQTDRHHRRREAQGVDHGDAGGTQVGQPAQRLGGFETDLVDEFLRGLANHAKLTLHVRALAGANLLFQLRAAGAVGGDPMQGVYLALALIITLTTVIGGRVIPMFTVNGLQGAVSIAQHTRHDTVAIALSVAALLAWALALPAGVSMPLAAAAALAQANRIVRWQPWATLRVPLLWILHLSHAWIPLGLTLLALSEAGLVPRSAAIHGLALGAMSGLILGMITRTALGHTGRLLQAGPVETAAYVALHLAVLARVLPLLFAPHHTMAGLMVAALGWCLAFGLYLLRYGPMLVRVRADGKPG